MSVATEGRRGRSDRALGPPRPLGEGIEAHTGILRLALGIEDSRSYWEHADPAIPVAKRASLAFDQRWFGNKSMDRVRFLLSNFAVRYDGFPEAFSVLRRWRSMDASVRQVICHWHLQLSDPTYRRFAGHFLVERRGVRDPKVDRAIVLRWIKSEFPDRWSEATYVQFASKLLSAASEAGLVSSGRDPRTIVIPKVPDRALFYLLYLLRGLEFAGTLTENPYLASVGLTNGVLDQRLRTVPGLGFRRMARLTEFDWEFPALTSWADATL
jgi:hypothetical protein